MTLTAKEKKALEEQLQGFVGTPAGPDEVGLDLVNEPMIRHWCDAMGDALPVYADPDAGKRSVHGSLVAPPTMLQAWVLGGMQMVEEPDLESNHQRRLHQLLTDAGYPSVVATNCEQEYTRYLKPGDQVIGKTVFEYISEEKSTGLGVGYFIDTRTTFSDQNGAPLGWMTFRVLKFRPNQPQQAASDDAGGGGMSGSPVRLRPPMGHDNAWWWDGIQADELRIQKCGECGTLRHPPRPMCGKCQSTDFDWDIASGDGTVYSFTILHHPPVPGYEYPLAVGLIELAEGTRITANVQGCEPSDIKIGMKVQCRIENVDDEMKLPMFYPAA